ncbi:di-heme oxidoredictase family protein [Calycomorphotria hydatis]|uniref:Cytochrome c n=1 Tax=Calycomorphotria hydatis TaxID=2528027 RepID=A0A517TBD4_9PLAN|nr:di-heme oxidoredictase family protein [Calycomorphotria hydatis]QDT65675.1 Cytochrome c [Calycomorphotria hydatis]
MAGTPRVEGPSLMEIWASEEANHQREQQRLERRRELARIAVICSLSALLVGYLSSEAYTWILNLPTRQRIAEGKDLFVHEWEPQDSWAAGGDGLGPVFNGRSCVECHFQGGVGGGGPNENNVLAFQVLPSQHGEVVKDGVVHDFAIADVNIDSKTELQKQYPVIPKAVTVRGLCFVRKEDFNPLNFTRVNTPALFGIGLIDSIPINVIRMHKVGQAVDVAAQELQLKFDQTTVGRIRELPTGQLGKFGWKGQFSSLQDFVAAACAVELGLTNPDQAQNIPGQFVEDVHAKLDLSPSQFRAMVAFVRTLPRPEQILPEDEDELATVRLGEQVFAEIGCTDCHTPTLGGVTGLYSDLCLHRIVSPENSYFRDPPIPLPQALPEQEEWRTPPLWGVADSAPYWHDGSATTLPEAIIKHGGVARHVLSRYRELPSEKQQAIIAFLETLRAPQSAIPAKMHLAVQQQLDR